jgi:hypothetical protein
MSITVDSRKAAPISISEPDQFRRNEKKPRRMRPASAQKRGGSGHDDWPQ